VSQKILNYTLGGCLRIEAVLSKYEMSRATRSYTKEARTKCMISFLQPPITQWLLCGTTEWVGNSSDWTPC